MNKKREMICASELIKTRSWTNSLIKRFLPTPDDTKTNPIFKSAAPMKLYNINKVKRIERSRAFIDAMEVAQMKKDSALKATETKKAKTFKTIENLNFNIPDIDKEKLIQRAINHYEAYHDTSVHYADEEFINRIVTNYLRHNCTKYDNVLDRLYGYVGKQEAHDIIKQKVNDAIKDTYTWLQE